MEASKQSAEVTPGTGSHSTPTGRRAVALVQQNQSARLGALAQLLKKSPMRASGFMQQLVRKLFELGYPCLGVTVLPDGERLYHYQDVDRGSQ